MNEPTLVSDGVFLMLIGMGTVFTFLSVLVVVTSLLKKVISQEAPIKTKPTVAASHNEIAAAAAAVKAYRQKYSISKD